MKKIFTLIVAIIATVSTMAQTTEYVGPIDILVDDVPATLDDTSVLVTKNTDGTYKVELRNFSFAGVPVGNITVSSLTAENNADGSISLTSTPNGQNNIKISGSALALLLGGGLQGDVTAKIDGNKFILDLPLEIATLGQTILVHFEGESTSAGIGNITADAKATVVYNIAGQKANESTKGIVIKNGKKYVK